MPGLLGHVDADRVDRRRLGDLGHRLLGVDGQELEHEVAVEVRASGISAMRNASLWLLRALLDVSRWPRAAHGSVDPRVVMGVVAAGAEHPDAPCRQDAFEGPAARSGRPRNRSTSDWWPRTALAPARRSTGPPRTRSGNGAPRARARCPRRCLKGCRRSGVGTCCRSPATSRARSCRSAPSLRLSMITSQTLAERVVPAGVLLLQPVTLVGADAGRRVPPQRRPPRPGAELLAVMVLVRRRAGRCPSTTAWTVPSSPATG